MSFLARAIRDVPVADRVRWFIVGAFGLLWVSRWASFPFFIDIAYHLSIAKQMVLAGGWFSHEAWANAPPGRPHLYPPVLHALLSNLLQAGLSAADASKLLSAAVVPLVLSSVGSVSRRLFGPDKALAAVCMAAVPFGWWIQVGGALASGIALIELLWLIVAVTERRTLAAVALAALLCYTHLGMPLAALVAMLAALCLGAVHRQWGWWGRWLCATLFLALPWLWHLLAHLPQLRVAPRFENASLEMLPAQLAVALTGIAVCLRARGPARWAIALLIGVLPLAVRFPARALQGEGALALVLLAAFGVDWISERADPGQSHGPRWVWICLVSACVAVCPTLALQEGRPEWVWPDAAPFHLLRGVRERDVRAERVYTPEMDRLADTVRSVTAPGTILWSNAPYAGGLIAALAGRPTSSAMFYEVPAGKGFDPLAAAGSVVWFRIPNLPDLPPLSVLGPRYGFAPIAEDPLAVVYRTASAGDPAHPPKAKVPWAAISMVLYSAIGAAWWDLRRGRRQAPLKTHE